MTIFPLIMAGGPGSRLWPESRRSRPKPFLPLLPDGRSLFRATLDRVAPLALQGGPLVAIGASLAELALAQAPELEPERLLREPSPRDTALCAAWASLEVLRLDPDAALLVLPSDHLVEPDETFRETIRLGAEFLRERPDELVVFGIEPRFASTAYGYVERGENLGVEIYRVARFREKPNLATATEFLQTGRFFWNAGIFLWRAETYLRLLEKFEPEFAPILRTMRDKIDAARARGERPDDDPEFARAFSSAKRISIDRAVLERAESVAVVRANKFAWSDLGSFGALEETDRREEKRTNSPRRGIVIEENSFRNLVRVRDPEKLVALVDVDDLLIVETPDALLVAKNGSDDGIKRLVKRLGKEGLDSYL
ncbi:MAG: mannose-1-phosphate guanylyltransferase [Thermoguttaceae bacterium]|nr:mannose-1-phosphate guanylyltransferase [Thermoguttaceae bacterium]